MLLERATFCAKRMASVLLMLTPRAAIWSRTMPVKVWPDCTDTLQGAVVATGLAVPANVAERLAGTTNSPPGCCWAAAKARVNAGAERANAKGLRANWGNPEASVLVTVGFMGGSNRMGRPCGKSGFKKLVSFLQ